MLELPFVFCNSAHCYIESVLFILDAYELKVSLILTVLSFVCMQVPSHCYLSFSCVPFLYKCVFL